MFSLSRLSYEKEKTNNEQQKKIESKQNQ